MKAILISIRPEWVAKILNGEKTIEIRKRFPSDYVGWVYIYCTKDGKSDETLCYDGFSGILGFRPNYRVGIADNVLNGKVVARFWCNKVEKINAYSILDTLYETTNIKEKELLKVSCLTYQELNAYLKHKIGYAIHITKLEIFDKPMFIYNFYQYSHKKIDGYAMGEEIVNEYYKPLTRAPQSYCFIEA